MKQAKVRRAEPSSAPGEAAPNGVTAPENSGTRPEPASALEPEMEGVTIPPILLEGDEPARAPLAEEPPKDADSPTAEAGRAEPAPSQLPTTYGTGRLLLMACDPANLYAHWDLTQDQKSRYAELSADHHLVVRVHRESLSGPLVTELQVDPESNHGFMAVGSGGTGYVAELGYHPPDSAWKAIAVSELAVTPGEKKPEEQPIRFGTLRFASGPDPNGEPAEDSSAVVPPGGARARRPSALLDPQFPLPPPLRRVSAPIAGWSKAAADALASAAEVPAANDQSISAWPEEAGHPDLGCWVVPAQAREWTEAQESALAELLGRSVSRREWMGSAGIEELIRRELRIVLPGRVAPMEAVGVPWHVSSAVLGQGPPAKRGFWLNVNAELVIYGATEPDARVTIGGQPVQLRRDGTFSCRFALPDGFYQIATTAVSAQGELRQAELDFSRSTAYSGAVGSAPQDPGLKPPLAS